MKRRDFLTTSCAAGITALSINGLAHASDEPTDSPSFVDLQLFTVPNPDRMNQMIKFHGGTRAALANRFGGSPIGLFVSDKPRNAGNNNYDSKYDNMLFSMISHPTLDSTLTLPGEIRADKQYMTEHTEMTKGTTSKDPLFTAQERMLLRCFDEFPRVEVPTLAKTRILQLRIYRSHNFDRNRAKIEMFTSGGELALFQECGMNPVFFCDMLFGTHIPSLAYMLSFESEKHMDEGWKTFVSHPEWKKMSSDPKYADTATEITNIFLSPCEGSQI